MNDAIVTRSLVKLYRGGRALDSFSLSVPTGSTMGLVGRNGAGKTTWMMAVAGFVLPDSGEISILGLGPFDADKHAGRFAILPQDSELPLEARPGELLARYGRLQGLTSAVADREADSLLAAFNLSAHANKPMRALSHGMRKKVMVAQAFIGSPDVVLLDEPLSGLDPEEANRMRAFIRARRRKETIVISSHNLDDIEKLCTHVAFIGSGRLERVDTLAALTSGAGRLVVTLRRRPDDLAALETLVAGVRVSWREDTCELTVEFDPATAPEEVNARLLPMLFSCGVVSVSSGMTLEQAYLAR
ncbi:MAG: ABC transporter ATP-binding protein [Kiritimatiellae bacterium]|nr:ABC transporter ATP-binding protein [Kiritimatiellia bacterium]